MSDEEEWLFRVDDILHSVERIEIAIADLKFDIFNENEDLQDIVDRRFQIIGEAARKIPERIKSRYPDVLWTKMIGLRNFVVHEYNSVDRRLVWDTIQREFPKLKKALGSLKEKEMKKHGGGR